MADPFDMSLWTDPPSLSTSSSSTSLSSSSSSLPQTTPSPANENEFKEWLNSRSTRHTVRTMPSDKCSLCDDSALDVRSIARSCMTSMHPCEGHKCNCFAASAETKEDDTGAPLRLFPCCFSCLAGVLWNCTNDFMRKQARFRGHCPFCKAEFCHEDIVLLSLPRPKTPPPRTKTPPPATRSPPKTPPKTPPKSPHHRGGHR